MSSHLKGLTPEEFQILEQEKIVGPSIDGKRTVSTGLSYSNINNDSIASSTSSGTSILIQYKGATNFVTFDLPESPESVALIEYLGYTRAKAEEIFARWSARPDPESNPYSLKDHALVELSNLERAPLRNLLDRPAEAMRDLGIAEEMVNCMMAPGHKDMLETETPAAWLDIAMRSRYGTAIRYLDILKARAVRAIRTKKDNERGNIDGVLQPGGSTSDTDVALATSSIS